MWSSPTGCRSSCWRGGAASRPSGFAGRTSCLRSFGGASPSAGRISSSAGHRVWPRSWPGGWARRIQACGSPAPYLRHFESTLRRRSGSWREEELRVNDRRDRSSRIDRALSAAGRRLTWFWSIAERTNPVAIGLGLIGLAFVIHIPTLSQPLLETQSFRQTTTAYPALLFYQHGIDLFHPQVPVFGPPFVLPIEFPLFQAAASLVMHLGVSPDAAVRLTALVCFLITASLVWRLLVALAGEAAGLAGLAAFLFSPLGLIVSRMSLIEYMATAGALALVLWGLYWHSTGKRVWYFAAMAAGAVGLLVKPTTSVMY